MMPVEIQSNRRLKSFKNEGKKDDEENRRRRNTVSIELRKARKDDQLMKKRQISLDLIGETNAADSTGTGPITFDVPTILAQLQTGTIDDQYLAVQTVRRILSKERQPPIDIVINAGLVPFLIKYLPMCDTPKIQFEAAWALTNIASGSSEQTRIIVEAGAVPLFIKQLTNPIINISEQAVWALGNICGDGPDCRDLTTRHGIIPPLLLLAKQNVGLSYVRNITWVMSNLCRNKNPPPNIEAVKQLLPTLIELAHHEDREVVTDACWGLSYVTDGTEDRIQLVVDYGEKVFARFNQLLQCSTVSVITPALRAVGNIVTGSDQQTQKIIDAGILKCFHALMKHSKMSIQKEAAWTISNITAGLQSQIQAVIDNGLIPPLVKILVSGDFKAQKEAVWAVTNLTAGGLIEQISYLVFCGVLKPLCDLLACKDGDVLVVILEALINILQAADKVKQTADICKLIEEAEGLDKIEALQTHESENVYQMALAIIDKYFQGEDEEQAIAPKVGEDNVYVFNSNNAPPTGGFNF